MTTILKPYHKFDLDSFLWASERDLLIKVERGITLRKREEMTREYYEQLIWLLVAQMDSEYVGAFGYVPLKALAPRFDPDELRNVPQIVYDEFVHGNRIRRLLIDLEFDADSWVGKHYQSYEFRIKSGEKLKELEGLAGGRLTKDFRVNIFYYPIVVDDPLLTWINFTIFQFVQDRGAGEQLQDAIHSSFEPWAEANRKIAREENRHIHHGDMWMAKLFAQHPDLVRQQFRLWWPRSLATFGRPSSGRNDLWRKLGLKRRANEQVLRDFLDGPNGIHAANKNIGLEIPETEEVIATWREGKYVEEI